MEHLVVALAAVIVLGIFAQWLAWRIRVPAILLLLITGFVAGPVTGYVDPDVIFGDLLFPFVSLSVALILFEGGLNLDIGELEDIGHGVARLVTVGVLLTWSLTTTAAFFILELSFPLALLLGAILVVTGPTVIVPLLRQMRLKERVGSLTRWEGIVNDPIGAVLAVLVFEAILVTGVEATALQTLLGAGKVIVAGTLLAGLGAGFIVLALSRYWVPDFLRNPVTLVMVILIFEASNLVQPESGLVAVTVMGVILANQSRVSVGHIIDFKEDLRVLLISVLFVILAARLDLETIRQISISSVIFVTALVLIVRPASVFLSTWGTPLNWREKAFLSAMAPRGIVAAAVSSLFALQLVEKGYPEAEVLVSETFLVITATVSLYGLLADPLAKALDLREPSPQGVVFVGAQPWARKLALALQDLGFNVRMVDGNRQRVRDARLAGIEAHHGRLASEKVIGDIDLRGIGKLVALSDDDEKNALAAVQCAEEFGSPSVFQLEPEPLAGEEEQEWAEEHLKGRTLFREEVTYATLQQRFEAGAEIVKTRLTEEYGFDDLLERDGQPLPIFLVRDGELEVFAEDDVLEPEPGDVIVTIGNQPEAPEPESDSGASGDEEADNEAGD